MYALEQSICRAVILTVIWILDWVVLPSDEQMNDRTVVATAASIGGAGWNSGVLLGRGAFCPDVPLCPRPCAWAVRRLCVHTVDAGFGRQINLFMDALI